MRAGKHRNGAANGKPSGDREGKKLSMRGRRKLKSPEEVKEGSSKPMTRYVW